MKRTLVRLAIVFGIITIIVPFAMIYLWTSYVTKEETTQGNTAVNRQACEPYNVALAYNGEGKLQIVWETKKQCSGFVLLGTTYADFGNLPYKVMPTTENSSTGATYNVILQKQDEMQYVYALIVSENQWYGIRGQPFILPKAK